MLIPDSTLVGWNLGLTWKFPSFTRGRARESAGLGFANLKGWPSGEQGLGDQRLAILGVYYLMLVGLIWGATCSDRNSRALRGKIVPSQGSGVAALHIERLLFKMRTHRAGEINKNMEHVSCWVVGLKFPVLITDFVLKLSVGWNLGLTWRFTTPILVLWFMLPGPRTVLFSHSVVIHVSSQFHHFRETLVVNSILSLQLQPTLCDV